MKKMLLGGVAAVAAMSLAGVAAAQTVTTGYVGLTYNDIENGSLTSLAGTASLDVAPKLELQVDGNIASLNVPGASSATIWGPTAHLFLDNGPAKAGVFVGYEDLDYLGNLTDYGVEGRIAVNNMVSAGASIGWGTLGISGAPDMDVTAYRVEGSVFITNNLRADVNAGNLKYDWGPFSGASTFYGLGAEWQLNSYPVSFTAGYTQANSTLLGAGTQTWSIGIRRTFGGSLKDRDRTSSPFQDVLGGIGGLGAGFSGIGSVANDVLNCVDDNVCSSSQEVSDFVDQFDQTTFANSYYCAEFYGDCSMD